MINSAARSLVSGKKWYRNISAGNPLYSEMELIATTLVSGGSTATVAFDVSSLANAYKHLQIRTSGRSTQAINDSIQWIRFNGDTGSNYAYHYLTGNGSSVSSLGGTSQTLIRAGHDVGANSASNIFGANVYDILDPFSSTKNKTLRGFSGIVGASPQVFLTSGVWLSTSVVTTVNIYVNSNVWLAGTRLSLYGIKG